MPYSASTPNRGTAMRRWLSDRENRTGAFVVLVFAWAPFWMISGLVIGGKTAAEVGLYVAVAPFAVTAALFVLTVFGAPFFISKPLERLGAILIMGGLAYWLFGATAVARSEEHTSELQSLMRISYAVFCLKKKNTTQNQQTQHILNY